MLCRRGVILFSVLLIFVGCKQEISTKKEIEMTVVKKTTESEWTKLLSADEYYVLRQKGTEPPYTGKYTNLFETGTYSCAGCGEILFESEDKFDSHCGWPSFDRAIEGTVEYVEDRSFNMLRTEVLCANCGGHLGHVFPDGPEETTGERYCINSISMVFNPKI